MLRLEHFDDPEKALRAHTKDLRIAGADAFGRGEDFFEDVDDHFLGSEWGNLIIDDDVAVGFTLLSSLPEQGAYLEGIAVKKAYQSKGLGLHALTACVQERKLTYLTATTRNPATVKIMGGVGSRAVPDIRAEDPFAHSSDEKIRRALMYAAQHKNLAEGYRATMPFLPGRYPQGLYGADPGVGMQIPFITEDETNAFLVASIVDERLLSDEL